MPWEDKGVIMTGWGREIGPKSSQVQPRPDRSMRRSARPSVRLDIPSRIEMLETADALVAERAAAAGFAGDSAHDIQIAAHEAVINAILHGNQLEEARRVTLEVSVRPTGIEIRVQDEGPGFDPACVPDPLAPENLGKAGGRGILLMRTLMDEVTFRRSARGTQVTMRKRVEPTSQVSQEA